MHLEWQIYKYTTAADSGMEIHNSFHYDNNRALFNIVK
jgi:hypothetical protein